MITWDEVVKCMGGKVTEDDRNDFNAIDKNGDGNLTREEMYNYILSLIIEN